MKIRSFLALSLPVVLARRLADEIAALQKEPALAGWKVAWVPAANLHLTLKFFGMVEGEALEAVHGRLRRELAGKAPFDLELRGLGAFPGGDDPQVLWAGVAAQNSLAALQKNVEEWMVDLGFAAEARAFHPHVTIGRVRERGGEPIAALLASRSGTVFGTARAAEVVIYESRTRGPGSEYVALGRVGIGAV